MIKFSINQRYNGRTWESPEYSAVEIPYANEEQIVLKLFFFYFLNCVKMELACFSPWGLKAPAKIAIPLLKEKGHGLE